MGQQILSRLAAAAVVSALAIASASHADAAGLKCECTNCAYKNGRAQDTYRYDPNFNNSAAGRQQYNDAEHSAMTEADLAAANAINAAKAAAPSCPDPCDPQPAWDSSHGPPFAGGTGGSGIARSLWKVTYSCFKRTAKPPPPPPSPTGTEVTPLPPEAGTDGDPILVEINGWRYFDFTDCPVCNDRIRSIMSIDHDIKERLLPYYQGGIASARRQGTGESPWIRGQKQEILLKLARRRELVRLVQQCHYEDDECPYSPYNTPYHTPPSGDAPPPGPPPSEPVNSGNGFGFGGFGFGFGGGFGFDRGRGDHGR
jgi:hypothetical protein